MAFYPIKPVLHDQQTIDEFSKLFKQLPTFITSAEKIGAIALALGEIKFVNLNELRLLMCLFDSEEARYVVMGIVLETYTEEYRKRYTRPQVIEFLEGRFSEQYRERAAKSIRGYIKDKQPVTLDNKFTEEDIEILKEIIEERKFTKKRHYLI